MKKARFLEANQVLPSEVRLEKENQASAGKKRGISLLFVHGIYHGAWAFKKNLMPYFSSRGYDCHAFSWRGHGASEGKENLVTSSFDDYLADLRQVVSGITGPIVLVGHSAGATLIQKHLESETASAAVLIASTSAEAMRSGRAKLAAQFFWPILKLAVTGNPDHLYHDREIARKILFNGDLSSETEDALDHIVAQPESHQMLKDLFEVEPGEPSKPLPVLVVVGGRDVGSTKASVEELTARYDAEVALFEECAHELIIMPGWEKIAESIDNWLTKEF